MKLHNQGSILVAREGYVNKMKAATKETVASCPNCGRMISLGIQIREGHSVTCLNCGAYLEIISLNPLEIDWVAGEFEEDRNLICLWNRPLGRKASRQHWRWAAST
jgi:lysine biosynthesis protein LysW